jgi:hypothetical protein
MEGQAEDLDMEVNGVAGQIAVGSHQPLRCRFARINGSILNSSSTILAATACGYDAPPGWPPLPMVTATPPPTTTLPIHRW